MSQTLFETREHAFEAKFAHDAEREFIVRTRGGAMFVQWIAGLLGLSEEVAMAQASRMIDAVMNGQSDKSILNVVSEELAERGQALSARQLAAKLIECREQARRALHGH